MSGGNVQRHLSRGRSCTACISGCRSFPGACSCADNCTVFHLVSCRSASSPIASPGRTNGFMLVPLPSSMHPDPSLSFPRSLPLPHRRSAPLSLSSSRPASGPRRSLSAAASPRQVATSRWSLVLPSGHPPRRRSMPSRARSPPPSPSHPVGGPSLRPPLEPPPARTALPSGMPAQLRLLVVLLLLLRVVEVVPVLGGRQGSQGQGRVVAATGQ